MSRPALTCTNAEPTEDECARAEVSELTRLRPTDGSVWVVRWIRRDGRDVVHRFYMRRHAAVARADLLRSWGKDVAVFESAIDWQETS